MGAALAACLVSGCAIAPQNTSATVGVAELQSSDGVRLGSAVLTTEAARLRLAVNLSGMSEGAHGFHLHTTGSCVPPDYKSAGGHLNPDNHAHGTLSPDGSHLGDLPNLTVGSDGEASATFTVSETPGRAIDKIFDADGTAVIVHAKADDYRTDPSGAAGPRIACGILTRN